MRYSAVLVVLLVLVGCSEPRKEVKLGEVLPNIPVPPNGEVVSREGGEDAIKIRFRTPASPEQVATYYRELLSREPWRLVSDVKTQDGAVALYAEQNGPPLWVTIRKAEGAPGSFV